MYVAASFVGFLFRNSISIKTTANYQSKNDVVIQNDAATKPTVDSDNDANLNRIRKAVAVN
jgi:hypothetical protein